ncbi:ROK family protein [Paenibacillus sp. Marseille-Q4541]|uniref:ROK family protein n=1 Tax=Paenibacillus sp. Marseille-Q4541 TaxID=2831522 RepID=UPI001BAC08E0|nr:ROK family protein [Paenibacillus sp. Marseille-Q4541]
MGLSDTPYLSGNSPAKITLALDAGGTVLKGAVLVNGVILSGSYRSRPSESNGPAAATISSFADLCVELLHFYTSSIRALHKKDQIQIGFAFPGPFQYAEGIALLQGVGKYEALYNLSVRDLLRVEFMKLYSTTPTVMSSALASADIRFGNDAFLFGLGISQRYPSERLLCLTLGTGLGSAFIEKKQIIKGIKGIPSDGMLFNEPYLDHIVDSYFGRRGILKMAREQGVLAENTDSDVADLAKEATGGNQAAKQLFEQYGQRLGEMLLPYMDTFRPNRILLGGQIANSFPLWEENIQDVLKDYSVPILQSPDGMIDVFTGIDTLFNDTNKYENTLLTN